MRLQLQLELESDTAFGRGEGLAGLLDDEVEYDLATGLPFVRGRTLKGLLVEECANLLFAVSRAQPALRRRAACVHYGWSCVKRLSDPGLISTQSRKQMTWRC